MRLPGSMLTNHKGRSVTCNKMDRQYLRQQLVLYSPVCKIPPARQYQISLWLTPEKYCLPGAAWYQKEVIILLHGKTMPLHFFLERCHTETMVWVDKYREHKNSLVAPHEYDLRNCFAPVNIPSVSAWINRLSVINVGRFAQRDRSYTGQLEWHYWKNRTAAKSSLHQWCAALSWYQISRWKYCSQLSGNTATLKQLECYAVSATWVLQTKKNRIPVTGNKQYEIILPLGDKIFYGMSLILLCTGWVLTYNSKMVWLLRNGSCFGMRDFKISSTHFTCNDKPVFKRNRGLLCFPLTGFPPASITRLKIFDMAKSHGLNHMRFHSWCPPEAAFEAADIAGFIYNQKHPPGPITGVSLGDSQTIDQYICNETNHLG